MVSVDTGILLATLGEDVTITPSGAAPVATRAIVSRARETIADGAAVLRDTTLQMATAPAIYAVGDAVRMRNANWIVQSVEFSDDPAWVVYRLRDA